MYKNESASILKLVACLMILMVVSACNSGSPSPAATTKVKAVNQAPTETSTWTQTTVPTTTPAKKPTYTAFPTPTPINTRTPRPTSTPTIELQKVTPMLAGTHLAETGGAISLENIDQLANVARWGNGSITGVAFAPDGKSFVVGSAYGFAVYSDIDGDITSTWIAFDQPFYYENMFFSQDGKFILLDNESGGPRAEQIRSFPEGKIVRNIPTPKWQRTSVLSKDWGAMKVDSQDDRYQFKSHVTHDEEYWDLEFSVREVFDRSTGELLFELPDETIQVSFTQRTRPEGCDLSSFSYCGNAYSPAASHPYRVAFSPTGDSLAVLYRPPNLWNSNRFSTLRVYNAKDGQLISLIGGDSKPVETFAYSPDGKTILVGFVDGSVQLWQVSDQSAIFSSWQDFTSPIMDIEYSYDGKYLIVQRDGTIEARLASNGALLGRYDAGCYHS